MKSRLLLIAFLGLLCFEGYSQTISAGGLRSFALNEGGKVVSWGNDNEHDYFLRGSGLKGVVEISAGKHHSLALKEDGTVVAWGRKTDGQLKVPSSLKGVVEISAGKHHSLALKEDGTVVAWGKKKPCNVPSGLKGVVEISAGEFHSLALKEDGSVVAWGRNAFNQCNVPIGLKIKLSKRNPQ